MKREERLQKDGLLGDDGIGNYIAFYNQEDAWGVFSNFSEHGIWLPHPHLFTNEIVWYRTGEHRFQAMKATNEKDHEYIRLQPNSYKAKKAGREIELRPGWGNDYGDLCWYAMAELIMGKALQVPPAAEALVACSGLHIYEDAPRDDIWGWRKLNSYHGKNLLGRAWMQTRDILFGNA
jgi:ribA/ribD-fused uncharacterized protein